MRISCALLQAMIVIPSWAADMACDDASAFLRLACEVERKHILTLKKENDTEEKRLAGLNGKAGPAASDQAAKTYKVQPLEIWGSGGALLANFQLANGDRRDFAAGETVPGFGKIKAIREQAVIDDKGHVTPIGSGD